MFDDDMKSFELEVMQQQVENMINMNETTEKFGVTLTKEQAKEIIVAERETLKETGRFAFGETIATKIADTFCDSAYIYQDNYEETLRELIRIFYLYKNEAMDQKNDGELLSYMREAFENICEGDLDYLEGTVLDEYAREIRATTRQYIGKYQNEKEW